jgi:hypothetical protein
VEWGPGARVSERAPKGEKYITKLLSHEVIDDTLRKAFIVY